jgi:hypothetical protein
VEGSEISITGLEGLSRSDCGHHDFIQLGVYTFGEYRGICHQCGGPVTWLEPFQMMYIGDAVMGISRVHVFLVMSFLTCNTCGKLTNIVSVHCDPSFTVYPEGETK